MPVGRWVPVGTRAEGGCRDGAAALHRYLIDRWGDGVGSFGCYNPNSRAGSGWSLHREGRAIDVAIGPHVKAKGDGIFDWCVGNADALGLQEIQWYGRIWTSRRHSEGVRRDVSAAAALHYDHVHVGLADGRTFRVPDGVTVEPASPVDWAAFWRWLAQVEEDEMAKTSLIIVGDKSKAEYVYDGLAHTKSPIANPDVKATLLSVRSALGLRTDVVKYAQSFVDAVPTVT